MLWVTTSISTGRFCSRGATLYDLSFGGPVKVIHEVDEYLAAPDSWGVVLDIAESRSPCTYRL